MAAFVGADAAEAAGFFEEGEVAFDAADGEADFFGKVPNASVGCETWCEEGLYRKVTNGKFNELTEA